SRTLARAGAKSLSLSSWASEKTSGAGTRTMVEGISSGRQIVALSFAGESGSRAKGYPPATGKLRHGCLFGDLARSDSLQGLSEVLAVVRVAPQELPGKARAINMDDAARFRAALTKWKECWAAGRPVPGNRVLNASYAVYRRA